MVNDLVSIDEERMLHHDIEPLPNGNILAIAWELKTPEEAQAAGRRVDLIPEQGIWSEWILEVEPLPPNDARIGRPRPIVTSALQCRPVIGLLVNKGRHPGS